ncbi:hypothetical protein ACLMJK_009040 [Lecanora helva]
MSDNIPWYSNHTLDPFLAPAARKAQSPYLLRSPQARSIKNLTQSLSETSPCIISGEESILHSSSSSSCSISSCSSLSDEVIPENQDRIERAEYQITANDRVTADDYRTLLPPFAFAPPYTRSHQDGTLAQSDHNQSSPLLHCSHEPPRYVFYPPKNPSEKVARFPNPQRKVPRRQLSYGEPSSTPKSRTLHNTTGQRQPRSKVCQGSESDEDDNWQSNHLDSSTIRPWKSEPARNKPRVLEDQEEGGVIIQSALISIRRRHANTVSSPSDAPSDRERAPVTSPSPNIPDKAMGLGIGVSQSDQPAKEDQAFARIKTRPTWSTSLSASGLQETATVRRVSQTTVPRDTSFVPGMPKTQAPQLSELTTWILLELEKCIRLAPPMTLSLDSQVIQQIRLPAVERRVPRSGVSSPSNRFSGCQKLPAGHSPPPLPPSDPLPSLQTIFPTAPIPLLSSLQATYLALHHVSAISLLPPSTPSIPPQEATNAFRQLPAPVSSCPSSTSEHSYIPAKARAMSGLHPGSPTRPRLPTSWLKKCEGPRNWFERIEDLEAGLEKEVKRLLAECGCDGGDGSQCYGVGEALIRAVGLVVREGKELRLSGG